MYELDKLEFVAIRVPRLAKFQFIELRTQTLGHVCDILSTLHKDFVSNRIINNIFEDGPHSAR